MGVPLQFSLQKTDDIERQAKEWASILSNKIAREKAEKAARIMLEHDIELPQLKENGRMKKGVIAQFISDNLKAIEVNKKANDDVWKKDAQSVDIGWSSQNNPILHELGHYIDFICNEEKYNKRSENSRFFGEKKSLIEKELSKYAATNQWEFEAELISATLKGKTFSKELLSYSRLNNPEKNKELAKLLLNYGSGKDICTPVDIVREKFDAMMETVSKEKSKELDVSFLRKQAVQDFINTHTNVLNATLRNKDMPDVMRERMKESNYVFSGIKTFHELNEAFPSLIDSNGNKKPFEQFLNDVRKIDNTYNANYLKTEYEFAQSSAMMAARWKEFEKDGDNYYLQYRTVGDKRVRKTHRMLHNITLPFSSKFWDKYFPPNGWNCRCTVVQVRKDKYKMSDETAAMNAGSQATAGKHLEMFMFNPGKEMTTFPAYNAYTIKSCKTCPYRLGKMELSRIDIPNNELCAACGIIRNLHIKQQEIYKVNKNLYEKYKDDPNYINVEFNEKTGGMKATHKEHNFDNKKGWYETSVMEVGFQNGHSIIFKKEDHTVQNKKNVEGLWDNQNFEIGAAENFTKQNIRNALKHCAKKPNCDIAVIFVPDEKLFNKDITYQGIGCYEGLKKNGNQWKLFNCILFISKDRILLKYKQKATH